MTRFTWFMLVVGLVLAACNGPVADGDRDNIVGDHDGIRGGDATDNPFEGGDDTVEVRFSVDFGGTEETCMVHLTCEGESRPISKPSDQSFRIARDASCTAQIGDNTRESALTVDGRPTHMTPDGKLWAKTVNLEGFQGGDEIIVADRYFEAETIECSILYPTGVGASYTDHNVYVDEDGTFEVRGIAHAGSWFQVSGNHFDYGGREANMDWTVLDLEFSANHAIFTVDKVNNTFDVHCSW